MRNAIPDEAACLRLLERYQTPVHIVRHSRMVWGVAQVIGEALIRKGVPVDMALILAGSLLHDIGKYPCILDGTLYHDQRGAQIVEEHGYPAVARIVSQHVVLRTEPQAPVGEVHVVHYADKRVNHDELVSIDDRFVYLERTYAKSPAGVRWLLAMKEETVALEKKIFHHLDFEPEQLVRLVSGRLPDDGQDLK